MLSVPALALTRTWPTAAVLIILGRMGKATRNPPRDVMLSHAALQAGGYGWAFGVHEALDQFGAMFGPLLTTALRETFEEVGISESNCSPSSLQHNCE